MELNLTDVQEKKKQLEDDIIQLLIQFNRDTGLSVFALDIERLEHFSGIGRMCPDKTITHLNARVLI